MELKEIKKEDFPKIYEEMTKAFPKEEIRDKEDALAVLSDSRFKIFHTVEDGVNIGFITMWDLGDFTFLEHFVTYPENRCKGYGRRVIELIKEAFGNLLLECEHPIGEMPERRFKFYESCGFKANDYPYVQPSYRKGGEGVPLVLMTYPKELTDKEATVKKLYREVYGKEKE